MQVSRNTLALALILATPLSRSIDRKPSDPSMQYTLRVDAADLSAFAVEMRVRNAPDSFEIAMNAHPEYDDEYWHHLREMRVESPRGGASIARVDSALWRVRAPGGEATIRYRIVLPAPAENTRAAWRPFLSSSGGLVGGPHSFLYIVGHTNIPSHVSLDIPANWKVATGLEPTSDQRVFYAASVDELVEGPLFVGQFSDWRFDVQGVPHRVVYWWSPRATAFDSVTFVRDLRGVVEEAVKVFGRAPWREYTFVFQDEANGGLEHPNSLTLGAPSADLARDPHAYLFESAHEFFHAWNLMRIRPVEYRTVDWKPQPPTAGLWFSEGLTIFYSDLLIRRAGITLRDSTRAAHLGSILGRYINQPGNSHFSAERVSRAAYNAEPDALGDYSASTHLQGEVIGAMLDFMIRSGSDGRRNMDDLMRLLHDRHNPSTRGFTGADIERATEELCTCDVTPFFDAHVRGNSPIDYNRYLGLVGLRADVTTSQARDREGRATVDVGVFAYNASSDNSLRLRVSNPENAWARAGLHTGDRIHSVNGEAVSTWPAFRTYLARLRAGDTLRLETERSGRRVVVPVVGVPLRQAVVTVSRVPGVPERIARLRAAWEGSR
jgi:predicted metalloprotease with PDZ domain